MCPRMNRLYYQHDIDNSYEVVWAMNSRFHLPGCLRGGTLSFFLVFKSFFFYVILGTWLLSVLDYAVYMLLVIPKYAQIVDI